VQVRIRNIAKYFEQRDAIMPVAGLLNVRERNRLKFAHGKLIIPDGISVWVVDMQHRLKGIIHARDAGLLKENKFQFPIVITEGLDLVDEAAQFYVVNTKAKKMDVALTRRLLIENDAISELADVKPWVLHAVQTTIDLNTRLHGNPWYEAIRQPNEERHVKHIATEKSFVPSLRQIFIAGKYKQPHKVAKLLAAYWQAIEENVPEAFVQPRKYLLQKTPGMFTFNFFIAPLFLAKYREKDFARKLAGLQGLGHVFWKRSNKNGARRFGTGMGGYAQLAEHVKKHLGL
jgi:DGQHR domain-containing protein